MDSELPENSASLLGYHEKGFTHEEIDLNDLFQKEVEQGVAFELAFTAFLATAFTIVPATETILDNLAPLAGISLLGLTLIRKMALDSPIESENILHRSLRLIQYLTISGLLYIAIALSSPVTAHLDINTYFTTTIILVTSVMLTTVVYEYMFKDFMLWMAVLLYNKAHLEGFSVSPAKLILIAQLALSFSLVKYDSEHYAIKRIRNPNVASTTTKVSTVLLFSVTFLIIVVIGLIMGLPLIILVTESATQGVLLALAVIFSSFFASGLIEFIYARHGSASFRDEYATISPYRLIGVMYLVIIIHANSDWIQSVSRL